MGSIELCNLLDSVLDYVMLKTCNICNIEIPPVHIAYRNFVEHRDIVMCMSCAQERDWVRCNECSTYIHPDDQNQHLTLTYCSKCFGSGLISCDICCTRDIKIEMYEEDGDYLCRNCAEDSTFSRASLHVCDSYVQTQSARHYGIELETSKCAKYRHLKSHNCWGAKFDDSIVGKEFDSPKMRGDQGFEAIADICDFAKIHKWKTNTRCGYHLHVDVSKESAKNLRAIAYAYARSIPVWQTLVKKNRINNTWCTHTCSHTDRYSTLKNKSDWLNFAYLWARRYEWINWAAYHTHGTIEIRSHEATLDKTTICNWVRAHLAFVDWAVKVGCTNVKETLVGDKYVLFDQVAETWSQGGCDDLINYYVEKSTLDLELV